MNKGTPPRVLKSATPAKDEPALNPDIDIMEDLATETDLNLAVIKATVATPIMLESLVSVLQEYLAPVCAYYTLKGRSEFEKFDEVVDIIKDMEEHETE